MNREAEEQGCTGWRIRLRGSKSEDDCVAIQRDVAHWLADTRRLQLIDDRLFRSVQRARCVYYDIAQEIALEVVAEVAKEAVQETVDRQWQ